MTYEYRATLVRVIDGDTVVVEIMLGFHVSTRQTVRLLDVDTPERGQPDWGKAKAFVEAWMAGHPFLLLRSSKPNPRDKYQRYIADIVCELDGAWLNQAIRTSGFDLTSREP